MTTSAKLKEAFEVDSKHGAFYTGGNVEWHGDTLLCQNTSSITLLRIEDGVTSSIGEETTEDSDVIHTFSSDGERVVTSHKSGLLKLWTLQGQLLKMWKSIHKGPIARFRMSGEILASGGSDGCVRIWNLTYQTCTQNLKGCQGVVNVVEINDDVIYASGDDGVINSWSLETGAMVTAYAAHYSKVTSLVFANDKEHFVTSGRDKIIVLWKIKQAKPLRTIPVFESVESITGLPAKFKLPNFKNDPDAIYVAAGGESGLVTVWDVTNAKAVYKQKESLVTPAAEGALAITKLDSHGKDVAVITTDHNIIIHNLKSFVCLKQFVGFTDEVLDLTFVGDYDSHLAVATNSTDIKLYDCHSMSCQLLKGHEDFVLALATSNFDRNLMLSSGKDNKVRLWRFQDCQMTCVAVGHSHTGSVGCVSFANTGLTFCVSAGQDTCLKMWQLPAVKSDDVLLQCARSEVAHDKDINSVAISPNDKIIATASQDKTAKLWTDNLTFVGTLKGHKRGVWCVTFSPIDQVVMTSSADCTIKLWSVVDLACLKTLEGHESSVLRTCFVSGGYQIISSGADGLIKLFNLKSSDCIGTFESHDGRVWAMALKTDESGLVTGGSDSLLVKWRDVTEERRLQRIKEEEELAVEEQKLSNYLQNGKLVKALKLALRLERPLQVLKIVKTILKTGDVTSLGEAISGLRDDQKDAILRCVEVWNTNSRNCQSAQTVLNILLNDIQAGRYKPGGGAMRAVLEACLPYTERHFSRLTQLLQDMHFLTYTVNCMQPHATKL